MDTVIFKQILRIDTGSRARHMRTFAGISGQPGISGWVWVSTTTNAGGGRRLNDWKEIAAFFKRDERTVRRWESQRGLPVHRVPGGARNLVYAYESELDAWLRNSGATSPNRSGATEEAGMERPLTTEAVLAVPPAPIAGSGTVIGNDASPARPRTRTSLWAGLALGAVVLGTAAGFAAYRLPAEVTGSAYTPAPEARDLYLSGAYHLGTRQAVGFTRAIQYLTEATLRDPGYADAYAKLAETYNVISQYTLMPADEAYPRAKAAAERAIALDPRNAAAYGALAFTEFYWLRDPARSRELFRQAIALDPGIAQIHHWFALTEMQTGDFEIPLQEIEKAQELDPQSRVILANKALVLFHAGRIQEAQTILRQLAEAEPNLRSPREYLATLYLDQKRYEDFLREYRTAATITKDEARLAIAIASEQGFRDGGEHGLLTAMLDEQKRQYALGKEPSYKLAATAALLGDQPAAIRYLEESMQRKELDMIGLRIDPAFKALHENERFRQIVEEVSP